MFDRMCDGHSRFSGIKRVTPYHITTRVLRFIENSKAKVDGKEINSEEIPAEEMERAEKL